MRELIYTPSELSRILLHYGEIVAMEMRAGSFPQFRIRARGIYTGLPIGKSTWTWQPMMGRYEPMGEPWITWPSLADLPKALRAVVRQKPDDTSQVCPGCILGPDAAVLAE